MNIFKIASDTVEKFNMLSADDRVLISISGGPDSVFLTLFLSSLVKKYKIKLYAFHLDHLTRNGDSTKDSAFVNNFCSELSIPVFTEKVDSIKWCKERKMNFQEGARLLRKNFLDKYASDKLIDKIALAHNADDLAETFIINFFRGSNLKGISAIKPCSGRIIRPLIYIYKKDIFSYLKENNINYCTDYTNLKEDYLRNKIRLSLIPYIENNFRKDIKNKIIKLAEVAREADGFIEKTAEDTFKKLISKDKNYDIKKIEASGFLKFDIDSVLALDEIIIKRVILAAISLLKGDRRDTSERKINDILRVITNKKPAVLNVSKNLNINISGKYIYFIDKSKAEVEKLPVTLSCISGGYFLEKAIKEKEIIIFDEKDLENIKSNNTVLNKNIEQYKIRFEFSISSLENIDINKLKSLPANEAIFDLSKISFPLKLKSWQPGDYFKPYGASHRKKLHDFFIDIKLPKECRRLVPLIFDKEKILWVFSYRTSEDVKISNITGEVLYLKVFTKN
jgi:tRNA(Ile)-lysidine synthase